MQLFQKRVFDPLNKDVETLYPIISEIWKCCPYHDATDHNIGRCLGFRYGVESIVNMGMIQVEFVPRV